MCYEMKQIIKLNNQKNIIYAQANDSPTNYFNRQLERSISSGFPHYCNDPKRDKHFVRQVQMNLT